MQALRNDVLSDTDPVPPEADAAPPGPPPTARPRALESPAGRLEWHLASAPSSAARDAIRNGLVIAHGFPSGEGSAATVTYTYPELADRVAQDTGWAALSFAFRGAGRSAGEYTPAGWLEDLQTAVEFLRQDVASVWLAGFGFGGSLALRAAALDPLIGGVAVLACPSDLSAYISDSHATAVHAHHAGLVESDTPASLATWGAELRSLDPIASARALPPRPLLIVHGSADDEVPVTDARALADATEGLAELRVIAMAGHRLRHDPRAIALLLGWLERQQG